MKKLYPLLSVLFLSLSIGLSQSKVNVNNLVKYGDKWFKENDDIPFSGIVFDLNKETGKKTLEYSMLNGVKNGRYKKWDEKGEKLVEGRFKDGSFTGNWSFYHKIDDKTYTGTYIPDTLDIERNGDFLKLYDENTIMEFISKKNNEIDSLSWYENGLKKYERTYKDGKEDRLHTEWYENGQKKEEGTYKDGKEDGLWTEWYEDGQKKEERTWKDGKEDGLWKRWYENGKKELEENYKNGKEDGLFIYWYENGQKEEETTWKDGKLDGLSTNWYENGQNKFKGTFKDHKLDGLQTIWYENGQKESEVNYKDGKHNGLGTWWLDSGHKEKERNFKDGKLISEKCWEKDGNEIECE